ncbi:MAG: ABC-2 transporter permease [Lachnospiraceae bacterium]|nr:ABC-2 transporter permease [Lachnospiraceae bacterium]
MLAIYKKEMRTYFTSIVGYLFLGFFLALIGLYFYGQNLRGGYTNFGYALMSVSLFFILLVPMLTMRIMAEENRQKTDQLLYTSPVSVTKIIIGKYLSVLTMFSIVMLIVCFYPLILAEYGNVNLKMTYAVIFSFFLMGAAYMAIGLFISSMTESQAFAAILTFVVVILSVFCTSIAELLPQDSKMAWGLFAVLLLLFAWLSYIIMRNITVSVVFGVVAEAVLFLFYRVKPELFDGALVRVFSWFSIADRYSSFTYGEFDIASIVYYLSYCVLFVFLTIQVVKKRRWA